MSKLSNYKGEDEDYVWCYTTLGISYMIHTSGEVPNQVPISKFQDPRNSVYKTNPKFQSSTRFGIWDLGFESWIFYSETSFPVCMVLLLPITL